jgi:hypothetical protein
MDPAAAILEIPKLKIITRKLNFFMPVPPIHLVSRGTDLFSTQSFGTEIVAD